MNISIIKEEPHAKMIKGKKTPPRHHPTDPTTHLGGEKKNMMTANSNIVFKGEPEQIKGFIEQQVTLCQEALATAESEAERNKITEQIAYLLKALP